MRRREGDRLRRGLPELVGYSTRVDSASPVKNTPVQEFEEHHARPWVEDLKKKKVINRQYQSPVAYKQADAFGLSAFTCSVVARSALSVTRMRLASDLRFTATTLLATLSCRADATRCCEWDACKAEARIKRGGTKATHCQPGAIVGLDADTTVQLAERERASLARANGSTMGSAIGARVKRSELLRQIYCGRAAEGRDGGRVSRASGCNQLTAMMDAVGERRDTGIDTGDKATLCSFPSHTF